MPRLTIRFKTPVIFQDLGEFLKFLVHYGRNRGYNWFSAFELGKEDRKSVV